MSVGLTKPLAAQAPKIFRLNQTLGPDVVVKLLVVVLRAFVDSLKVAEKPDPADLIDLADDLARLYTHDSIKDIVLALKEARLSGTPFYNAVDTTKLAGLIASYFERKAAWLENEHQDAKATGTSQDTQLVNALPEAAPKLLEAQALRIPAEHPAGEQLRRKLSITSAKSKRGLISPDQAAQQRAEVKRVLQNGRVDYAKPGLAGRAANQIHPPACPRCLQRPQQCICPPVSQLAA